MNRIAQVIPKVGLVMERGSVVRWLKNLGDAVAQGEPLLELETEKSVVEIEATASGRLVEQLREVGQEVTVGDTIAWLEGDDAGATAGAALPSTAFGSAKISPSDAGPTHGASAAGFRRADPVTQRPARLHSSPAARRLAAQNGIELSRVVSTGPQGRIQLADVQHTIQAQEVPAASPQHLRQPLSSMRRALARSMSRSNAEVPQFMVERTVDWSSVQAARRRAAHEPGLELRPTLNDFVLQALGQALVNHPALNVWFEGAPDSPEARLVSVPGIHAGLVVAVEGGLRVPVIHDIDRLSLPELSRARTDCVERALAGRMKQGEMQGAAISISNLGAQGPERFTAIVDPSQSAILAIGRQMDAAVVRDGLVQIRSVSHLTLTVDHRVADGKLASDFLNSVVTWLERDQGSSA